MKVHVGIVACAAAASLLLLSTERLSARIWETPGDGQGIVLKTAGHIPYEDRIEMAGERVACVLRWGIDGTGRWHSEKSLVFPALRVIPNGTYGSLRFRFSSDLAGMLSVNGRSLVCERVSEVRINGMLESVSGWAVSDDGIYVTGSSPSPPAIEMHRMFFPSVSKPAFIEKYTVRNVSGGALEVCVPEFSEVFRTDASRGVEGSYMIRADACGTGSYTLQPGDEMCASLVYQACPVTETPCGLSPDAELEARMAFVRDTIGGSLVLHTPDTVVNEMFRLAKLRASESIYATRGGYFHSPGGEIYYAGIWANDQAEYAVPFFPWLGYSVGNAASLNAFRHFARFMNPGYSPLPSSIVAEGLEIWNGAGDRGDAAMIAYGAARYALARADASEAEELWPLIQWCLEYCRRRIDGNGVVASDTDELEGRFPAGRANLCTSSLYYDALISAAFLGRGIGAPRSVVSSYQRQAECLRKNIGKHFSANVSGYETYRYYEGNTVLRSWICIPLVAGITERAEGTAAALLGPELMTENGLRTAQGHSDYWDRSTLYAIRGIFCAGFTDDAASLLRSFSEKRLTGTHVPYCIEAWPEGAQRHLSAESALFCRTITEGLFGMRPTGFHSFTMTPQLPSFWDEITLEHIRAFNSDFSVTVRRVGTLLETTVNEKGRSPKICRTSPGTALHIDLSSHPTASVPG